MGGGKKTNTFCGFWCGFDSSGSLSNVSDLLNLILSSSSRGGSLDGSHRCQAQIKELSFNTPLYGALVAACRVPSDRCRLRLAKTLTVLNITPSQAAANPLRQLSSNFHLIPGSTGGTDGCVPAAMSVCENHVCFQLRYAPRARSNMNEYWKTGSFM